MSYVVFKTPTILPIEAITTFGINSKPNSNNPIGFFGTGLKYAIAVLVRHEIPVTIFIGGTEHVFKPSERDFRDKAFTFISMRNRSSILPSKVQLPFTTELGKHWELWQAFRELHSNTLDEAGYTFDLHIANPEEKVGEALVACGHRIPGHTYIVVGPDNDFVEQFYEREKTFLPDAEIRQAAGNRVQILPRPSKHIYYRGLRVFDLDNPSMYTYNILAQIELTEDRTVKYPFSLNSMITEQIASREDDAQVIARIMAAPFGTFEHDLNFRQAYAMPSETFSHTARTLTEYARKNANLLQDYDEEGSESPAPRPQPVLNHSAIKFNSTYDPVVRAEIVAAQENPWEAEIVKILEELDEDADGDSDCVASAWRRITAICKMNLSEYVTMMAEAAANRADRAVENA